MDIKIQHDLTRLELDFPTVIYACQHMDSGSTLAELFERKSESDDYVFCELNTNDYPDLKKGLEDETCVEEISEWIDSRDIEPSAGSLADTCHEYANNLTDAAEAENGVEDDLDIRMYLGFMLLHDLAGRYQRLSSKYDKLITEHRRLTEDFQKKFMPKEG